MHEKQVHMRFAACGFLVLFAFSNSNEIICTAVRWGTPF